MKRIILLAVLVVSACQSKPQTVKPANNSTIASTDVPTEEFLISAAGIGKAKLGMTVGQLKQICDRDTKFEIVPSFYLDSSAIAVSQDGLTQYYILYPAGTTSHPDRSTPTDNDPIIWLMTDNHNYQTEEGVKVGTLIAEAEDIYGDAVLSHNFEGKPGEYVIFEDENSENIFFKASYFQPISDGLGYSGIYPKYPGVSFTTDKYRSDAAIAAIEVSCSREECF